MERHAWAASMMPSSAHAFEVAVGDGRTIRIDTPSTHFIAQHLSKPTCVTRLSVRPGEQDGAALQAEGGTQQRPGAVRIVRTNKCSTLPEKMDATLKIKDHNTGSATQSAGTALRHKIERTRFGAVRRSHLASTTESRV